MDSWKRRAKVDEVTAPEPPLPPGKIHTHLTCICSEQIPFKAIAMNNLYSRLHVHPKPMSEYVHSTLRGISLSINLCIRLFSGRIVTMKLMDRTH